MAIVDVATVLNQWQAYGIFDYVLPFLLIFAVVFALMTKAKILGENRAVNAIVALVIGLLALRIGFVQLFFMEIFPRLGVSIAVLLVAIILVAGFIPKSDEGKWPRWILMGLGALMFLVIIFNSFSALGWFYSNWFYDWGGLLIGALLIIGVVAAIIMSNKQ